MMKFTGLILICAASSLALLLPALGVVKFPMIDSRTGAIGANGPAAPAGLPIATPGLPGQGPPELSSPSVEGPEPVTLVGPPWTKQKLGLSAWLLLGPMLLLGLGLWTFGPNRGGSGR